MAYNLIWEADMCTRLYGVKSLVLKSNAHQRWQDQKPVSKSLGNSLVSCECVSFPALQETRNAYGEGNGTPLQYSCLENPMDGGAWQAAVHGVTKSWTRLSEFLSLFTFMHWRRKWQCTPVFLPGESQGRGSLVGCHLWGRTESDTTEATQQQQQECLTVWLTFQDQQPFKNIDICRFYSL